VSLEQLNHTTLSLNITMTVTTHPHSHDHHVHSEAAIDAADQPEMKRIWRLASFLVAHFGEDEVDIHVPDGEMADDAEEQAASFTIHAGEAEAVVDLETMVSYILLSLSCADDLHCVGRDEPR
jgi:hypothetical protein